MEERKLKYLLIIGLIAGGYYFFTDNQSTEVGITSYQEVLQKAEANEVSQEEVKKGAVLLATQFCNDSYFQETGGSSTSACLDKLGTRGEQCTERVFGHAPDSFYGKESVSTISKKFIKCTGSI